MMGQTIELQQIGRRGLMPDIDDGARPEGAWKDALNIAFRAGGMEPVAGYKRAYDPPSIAPYFLMPWDTPGNYYWIYAGSTAIYRAVAATHSDVSRTGGYTSSSFPMWTGGVLGGVPVLSNGVDPPQSWNETLGHFEDLPGWTSGWLCKIMIPYRNFLVALNMTEGATNYPTRVRWSTSADPGTTPATWTPSPTNDAGDASLSETTGAITAAAPLGDSLIIYKTDAVYRMRFIQGPFVMSFTPLWTKAGCVGPHAVSQIFMTNGRRVQVFISLGDVMITDGVSVKSLLQNRIQKTYSNRVNGGYIDRAFIAHNPVQREVWVCYPTGSSTMPDQALVWDYNYDTFTFRDIPASAHAADGFLADVTVTGSFDGMTGSFDSHTESFDSSRLDYSARRTFLAVPDATSPAIQMVDPDTLTFDGVTPTRFATATRYGQGAAMPNMFCITQINPVASGDLSLGRLTLYVSTDQVNSSVVGPLILQRGYRYDTFATGRVMGLRYEDSSSNTQWHIDGFKIQGTEVGQ